MQLVGTKDSPMKFIFANGERVITSKFIEDIKTQSNGTYDLELKDRRILINKVTGDIIFIGYKDLHKLTFDFFRDPKIGLIATLGYVLAMLTLAFHLWHGFQSAFQSLGATSPKITPIVQLFGKLFSVLVPLLFAIIPLYIHFSK